MVTQRETSRAVSPATSQPEVTMQRSRPLGPRGAAVLPLTEDRPQERGESCW